MNWDDLFNEVFSLFLDFPHSTGGIDVLISKVVKTVFLLFSELDYFFYDSLSIFMVFLYYSEKILISSSNELFQGDFTFQGWDEISEKHDEN